MMGLSSRYFSEADTFPPPSLSHDFGAFGVR
jgi:hypothetical protein